MARVAAVVSTILVAVSMHMGFAACPSFSAQNTIGGPSHPESLAVTDLNGDGHADLITANQNSADISVLLGIGDGTFQAAVQYRVGGSPVSVVTADFNRDGRMDVAVAVLSSESSVAILTGMGDGTFAPPRFFGVAGLVTSISAGDIDGDGNIDLVTSWYGSGLLGGVTLLSGNGDGTFGASRQTYTTGMSPSGTAVADINGDGHADVVVTNETSGNISVLLGQTGGTLAPPVNYPIPPTIFSANPAHAIVGDFNGDGKPDVATANLGNAVSGNASVLIGNGDGTFRPAVNYDLGLSPTWLTAADFNADGNLDIAVANSGGKTLAILFGRGDGTFNSQVTVDLGATFYGPIVAADFNGDGRADVAVANYVSNNIRVVISKGDGTFGAPIATALHTDRILAPTVVVTADVNNDGNPDLIVGNQPQNRPGSISVLLGRGDGTFGDANNFASGATVAFLAVADFNGDGNPDIAIANADPGAIWVLLGNGDGTFRAPVSYAMGTAPNSVVVGDFNDDGTSDIAAADVFTNAVWVSLGKTDGTFSAPVKYAVEAPSAMVAADFNGDGTPDLATLDESTAEVSILLGDGRGGFGVPSRFAAWPGQPLLGTMAVGDLNGDGRLDVAVANQDSGIAILLGDGRGNLGKATIVSTGPESSSRPTGIVLSDIDGDGKLDIAISDWGTENVLIFKANGDGSFASPVTTGIGFGDGPRWLAAADFDHDARTDFVTANDTSNVSVLMNKSTCASATAISSSSGPASGGQILTITGSYLSGTQKVLFGDATAQILSNNATSVTVRTPPHAAGEVDVVVYSSGGTATIPNGYNYFVVRHRAASPLGGG